MVLPLCCFILVLFPSAQRTVSQRAGAHRMNCASGTISMRGRSFYGIRTNLPVPSGGQSLQSDLRVNRIRCQRAGGSGSYSGVGTQENREDRRSVPHGRRRPCQDRQERGARAGRRNPAGTGASAEAGSVPQLPLPGYALLRQRSLPEINLR